MRVENFERFRQWVKNWGSNFASRVDSVVEDSIRFRNELRDGYNQCFPQKRVRVRNIDIRKPWLDDDILKGKIKEKNRLYALKLRTSGGLSSVDADRLGVLTSEVGRLKHEL